MYLSLFIVTAVTVFSVNATPIPQITGPAPAPPAAPNAGAPGGRCAADIDRLASGIQQNILVQQGEQTSVQNLGTMLQGAPGRQVEPLQFMAMKAQLLSFVTAGVAVRQNNQAFAPPGNPATAGLAIVASAQEMELSLSSSLSGDPAIDLATVQTLQRAFAGGIRQNMQNLLDATQGCVSSDVVAQRGVQAAQVMGLTPRPRV